MRLRLIKCCLFNISLFASSMLSFTLARLPSFLNTFIFLHSVFLYHFPFISIRFFYLFDSSTFPRRCLRGFSSSVNISFFPPSIVFSRIFYCFLFPYLAHFSLKYFLFHSSHSTLSLFLRRLAISFNSSSPTSSLFLFLYSS